MKISIALCVYNGEAHLREQLASYSAQTRLPDEVVICDDGSKDSTQEILTSFAKNAAFPVKLYFNEQNLGYIKNFEKAIKLCNGDIIVLSDQDDVWRNDKLKLTEAEFSKSEKIGMVYTDAEVVDESLNPLNVTMWECINFDAEKQKMFESGRAFELLLKDGYVLGSSMAFRACYRNLILPIPLNIYFIHDNWIALILSAVAEVSLIKELLVKYRQHQLQSSEGVKKSDKSSFIEFSKAKQKVNNYANLITQFDLAEMRLKQSDYQVKKAISLITPIRLHFQTRVNLPETFSLRFLNIGRELLTGRYHSYSNGIKSAIKDFIY